MKKLAFLVAALVPAMASADFSLNNFAAKVVEADVTYEMEVCGSGLTSVGVYYDLKSPPTSSTSADQTQSVSAGTPCDPTTVVRKGAPIALYQSYAMVDPKDTVPEADEKDNIAGPIEVCVGPDVYVKAFEVESVGAAITYKATVCNKGSMTAYKFRVGFWADRVSAPAANEMGDIFKPITSLAPASPLLGPTCVDVVLSGGLRPNGSFKAWCRADSGDFVLECREANNAADPYPYALSNPDLHVASFQAKVSGSTVSYDVKVCNKGTANVAKWYLDLYYHRPKNPPTIGDPGDLVKPVLSLAAGACVSETFQRTSAPKGSFLSYAFADPDDFVSEPDEANNLSMALAVQVGAGSSAPTTGCVDSDKDGFGVGPDCATQQDCDDDAAAVNPGAKETCGDKIDQNCNFTADDTCPEVDCADKDGDGWGTGKDCVLADCDDDNKELHPLAPEKCGDNKDDNCDKIPDDGCTGRECVDKDGDGYGVGKACPGPPDCSDGDFFVNPGAKEACGDGVDNDCDNLIDEGCPPADNDGDGYSVGMTKGQQPDCNDSDPSVNPGAKEICGDKIDNNCNGTIDDGCPGVDCVDKDGDGWGVGKECKVQDCDDASAAVHPWAAEACDKADNNCDGTSDEGCAGVDCKDGDGDGWGVGKDCKKPDCDDSDPALSGWMAEICGDGKDNNCDGQADEGCLVCEDKDGDGFGVGPKCANWDCDDKEANIHPGAPELCDGKDNDCNGKVDDSCSGGGGCGCRAGGEGPVTIGAGLALGLFVLAVRQRKRKQATG